MIQKQLKGCLFFNVYKSIFSIKGPVERRSALFIQ